MKLLTVNPTCSPVRHQCDPPLSPPPSPHPPPPTGQVPRAGRLRPSPTVDSHKPCLTERVPCERTAESALLCAPPPPPPARGPCGREDPSHHTAGGCHRVRRGPTARSVRVRHGASGSGHPPPSHPIHAPPVRVKEGVDQAVCPSLWPQSIVLTANPLFIGRL